MHPNALYNDALQRTREGDFQSALFPLQEAIAAEGGRCDSYRLMGKIHVQLGNLGEAEQSFRAALAIDPQDTNAAHCYGVLRNFRQTRRAAITLAALSSIAVLLGLFWYSTRSIRRLDLEIATVTARIAPRTSPTAERLPVTQSAAMIPTRSRNEAKALSQGKTESSVMIHAPGGSSEASKPVAAGRSSSSALPYSLRYQEAVAQALQGKLQEAVPLLEAISGTENDGEPLAGNAHFWLGRCLYQLKNTSEALKQFELVLTRFPESPKTGDALLDAGRCFRKLGNEKKAKEMWERLANGEFAPNLKAMAARQLTLN
jgi:TolA-binding protein